MGMEKVEERLYVSPASVCLALSFLCENDWCLSRHSIPGRRGGEGSLLCLWHGLFILEEENNVTD